LDVRLQFFHLNTAISRAREIGAHRDGSRFDLSPTEIELRRRVWAQLCILDIRYAEQLCREPTISPTSYDTVLPLSIDDRDLTEIEAQEAAARSEQENDFKTHQEVEYAQEQQSPFSPMTFSLVGAESARLFARLLEVPYHPRDAISFRGSNSKSQKSTLRTPSDKLHWIGQVEDRFQTVYGLRNIDPNNPLQFLGSELAAITISRATFATRLMEWKQDYGIMSERRKDTETIK
jgi:hypothetical protein